MKKIIAAVLLLTLCAAMLVSCGHSLNGTYHTAEDAPVQISIEFHKDGTLKYTQKVLLVSATLDGTYEYADGAYKLTVKAGSEILSVDTVFTMEKGEKGTWLLSGGMLKDVVLTKE